MVWPFNVTTGGVTSFTVTVKLQLRLFPAASVAVAVTLVTPAGKTDPEADDVDTVGTEQLSLAPTLKLTGAEQVPTGAFTTISAGQLIPGRVVSITVVFCVAPL